MRSPPDGGRSTADWPGRMGREGEGDTWTNVTRAGAPCPHCGRETVLVVKEGPRGPLVASICNACSFIRVPHTGVDADVAIGEWIRWSLARQP